LPQRCRLDETTNNLSYVSFDFGESRLIRKYSLREFTKGTYVPDYLQCTIVKSNLTRVINEFEITFLTNSTLGASLSPWERYGTNLQFAVRTNENAYFLVKGKRVRISTAEQENRMHGQHSKIRYLLLGLLFASAFVPPVVIWWFKHSIKNANTTEQAKSNVL